ncbi:hypothetical protein SUGI_1148070 [Cryptomeria japonica]|nr:hypothetical protein SUGI_1148070 [Cryptomeria japonica]
MVKLSGAANVYQKARWKNVLRFSDQNGRNWKDRAESWKDEEVGEEEGGEEEDSDQNNSVKETSRMDSGNEKEKQEEDEGIDPPTDHSIAAKEELRADQLHITDEGRLDSFEEEIRADQDQTIQPTPGDTQLAHVTPSLSSEHVRRRDSLDAVSVQDSPSDGRSVRSRHDPC